MEGVLCANSITTIERTTHIKVAYITEQFVPVISVDSIKCLGIAKCEPDISSTTIAFEYVSEYRIIEYISTAVAELETLIAAP